jgi:hypothetical protein
MKKIIFILLPLAMFFGLLKPVNANAAKSVAIEDNLLKQYVSPFLVSHNSITTTIVTLTPTPIQAVSQSSIHPLYMPVPILFVATVVNYGTYSTVNLDSYVKTSGTTTIRATVFGIGTFGGTTSFYVNYQYYENGVWVGSSQSSYSVY